MVEPPPKKKISCYTPGNWWLLLGTHTWPTFFPCCSLSLVKDMPFILNDCHSSRHHCLVSRPQQSLLPVCGLHFWCIWRFTWSGALGVKLVGMNVCRLRITEAPHCDAAPPPPPWQHLARSLDTGEGSNLALHVASCGCAPAFEKCKILGDTRTIEHMRKIRHLQLSRVAHPVWACHLSA